MPAPVRIVLALLCPVIATGPAAASSFEADVANAPYHFLAIDTLPDRLDPHLSLPETSPQDPSGYSILLPSRVAIEEHGGVAAVIAESSTSVIGGGFSPIDDVTWSADWDAP